MVTPAARQTLVAFTVLASLAGTSRNANGQSVVVVRPGPDGARAFGGFATTLQNRLPIGDSAVRDLIERYEPAILDDVDRVNHVTVVLDHDNNYVKSLVRAARVISAESGQVLAVRGDTVVRLGSSAGVLIQRSDADSANLGGRVVVLSGLMNPDVIREPSNGLMGTGFAASEVESVAVKQYAAGSIGKGQLIVTVLRLK